MDMYTCPTVYAYSENHIYIYIYIYMHTHTQTKAMCPSIHMGALVQAFVKNVANKCMHMYIYIYIHIFCVRRFIFALPKPLLSGFACTCVLWLSHIISLLIVLRPASTNPFNQHCTNSCAHQPWTNIITTLQHTAHIFIYITAPIDIANSNPDTQLHMPSETLIVNCMMFQIPYTNASTLRMTSCMHQGRSQHSRTHAHA
jgi:hypothetical protein